MTIKVEISRAADADRLAAIHNACFARSWDAGAIGDLLAVAGTVAFMAQDAGFGLLRYTGDDAEILTLAVRPEHRGSGIGLRLVGAMRAWAQSQGAKALFLEVGESNQAARGLYEKSGFSVISRRKEYYLKEDGSREHALVMRLEIRHGLNVTNI